MSLIGAHPSALAPCPSSDQNKRSSQRSLARSLSCVTKDSKTSKYTFQTPGMPGMRFAPSSSASSKPRVAKHSAKFLRRQKSMDGTILRAVPQAGVLAPDSALPSPTRKSTIMSPKKSMQSERGPSLELAGDDTLPEYSSPRRSAHSSRLLEKGVNPNFLGVWKDGTVHWANDSGEPPVVADGIMKSQSIEVDSKPAVSGPTTYEEAVFRGHRVQRPKIHLTIPKTSRKSLAVAYSSSQHSTPKRDNKENVSPPSSDEAPLRRMNSSNSTIKLSIVSPMTSDTPQTMVSRPRLPARTSSLKGSGLEHPLAPSHQRDISKGSCSTSSDSAPEDDDRSSCYSKRSSMSSIESEVTIAKGKDKEVRPISCTGSVRFSICSPGRAGVFDDEEITCNIPPISPTPKCLQSIKGSFSGSVTFSLAELQNKPLPPEPIEMSPAPLTISKPHESRASDNTSQYSQNDQHDRCDIQQHTVLEPAPLVIAGRPCSRNNTRKSSSPVSTTTNTPPSLSNCSTRANSPTCTIEMPINRNQRGRISLKSKYSTTSLDALDNAFQRSSPPSHDYGTETLDQVQQALEAHLSTITEDVPFKWEDLSIMDEPLQISRGPMQMEPSRSAPTPPPPSPQVQDLSMSRRNSTQGRDFLEKRKSVRRTNTITHVVSQMKDEKAHRQTSSADGGYLKWSAKAQKVLGTNSGPTSPDGSSDSPLGSAPSFTHRSGSFSPTYVVDLIDERPQSRTQLSRQSMVEEVQERLEILKLGDERRTPENNNHDVSPNASTIYLPIQSPSPRAMKTPKAQTPEATTPTQEFAPKLVLSNEDGPGPQERRGRKGSGYAPSIVSLASLAVSEIPDWYLNMPPSSDAASIAAAEEEERQISAAAAEMVLLRIMQSLDNLQDLFSTATVSKGFYRTFKRNELPLIKGALRCMSPAAWELREMTPPYDEDTVPSEDTPVPDYTPSSYLRYYTRDMYTMVALKSLILVRCESFLRSETISALAGNDEIRSLQLDDAFWRVWTFCKIFGSNKNREDDIVGQIDWLKGGVTAHQQSCTSSMYPTNGDFNMNSALLNPPENFGRGNTGGLTAEELYDMTEIWNCLGVLIRGFQGKREQAREFGVFDNTGIAEGDLEKEDAMLEEWHYYLLTLGPSVILDLATPSSLPNPERGFALAAENGWTDWEAPDFGASRSTFLKEGVTRVYDERMAARRNLKQDREGLQVITATQNRMRQHQAEIRARRRSNSFEKIPISQDRPMSAWQDALKKLHTPQVSDPVDFAVFKIVSMGFPASKARKALAETDTGECLDVEKAIELLVKEVGNSDWPAELPGTIPSVKITGTEVPQRSNTKRDKKEVDVAAGRLMAMFG
ncbi:MAG: hypothetical protein M1836_004686 [Candelina mexicana]|nr:MAG: hypothetical protein M1836_004686 [Candelina mexicana]